MKKRSVGTAFIVAAMTCVGLSADDKWELAVGFSTDDTVDSHNQLIHGVVQTHDLEGLTNPTDQDFSTVASKARHSYEVRVFNLNVCFEGTLVNCASLNRVDTDGTTILTAGIEPDGPLPNFSAVGWMAVRWTASADQFDHIRVNGYLNGFSALADSQYDIELLDTTYLVPRWNNSGTQVTAFIIQNGSTSPITGSLFFYNAAGALLATQPLVLGPNAAQLVSTASIPALALSSGTAAIAHDGTYGSLSGKAVALEPATGFTFDTVMTPMPR